MNILLLFLTDILKAIWLGWLSALSALILLAAPAFAATQYWDAAADSGLQGGDGQWSVGDEKWSDTSDGTALKAWGAGNDAVFALPSNGAPSVVTVASGVDAGSLTVGGTPYTIVVTNGGQIAGGTASSFIGTNSANNKVIVTGAGSAWHAGAQNVVIGSGSTGSWNSLLVLDGAVVSNGTLNIGALSASNNSVIVSNATLITGLSGGGNSFVGGQFPAFTYAQRNRLNVLPGGTWNLCSNTLYIGARSANNSLVVDGGLVTNVNGITMAQWEGSGAPSSGGNTLIVTNGGVVVVDYGGVLLSSSGYGSSLFVSGTGSLLRVVNGALSIDMNGIGNDRMEITRGGVIRDTTAYICNQGGNNCRAIVDGAGSIWSNSSDLWIGAGSRGNYNGLLVTNGGVVFSASAYIGSAANIPETNAFNHVIVTGSGSMWTNSNAINISYFKRVWNNYMLIQNSGLVYSAGATIGAMGGRTGTVNTSAATTGNYVSVSGTGACWDLETKTLAIGAVGDEVATNNWLTVGLGGIVTNVGLLNVQTNNRVNLYGGSITVSSLVLRTDAQIGVDGISPGILRVAYDADLTGYVTPENLPKAGKVVATILTCAGTLSGGLSLGPLPEGYSGRIETNIATSPKEIVLYINGPPGSTSAILTAR